MCVMYYGSWVINSPQNWRLDMHSTYRILERKAEERDYVLPFIVKTGAAHDYKRKDGSFIKVWKKAQKMESINFVAESYQL